MSEIAALAREIIVTGFDGVPPAAPLQQFGGFILFARNGTSVAELRACTDDIRASYGGALAPLIAIDQEGGRVARLKKTSKRFRR